MPASDQHHSAEEAPAWLLRHPLRQKILFKYSEGDKSPSEIAAALGEAVNLVSYHTRRLHDAGYIELVRTERRRGAEKHIYRALVGSLIEDAEWERLPIALRRRLARLLIDETFREAGDALPDGGMDLAESHMSRSYLSLDTQGWDELSRTLRWIVAQAEEIAAASEARAAADTAPFELVMLGFRRASRP